MHRDRPELVALAFGKELELFLTERDEARLVGLRHGQDRVPRGEHPGVHDLTHRRGVLVSLAALFERVPQVRHLGRAESVTLHVDAHAGAENVQSDELDDLEEQATALLVGDRVEDLLDLAGVSDLAEDRVRGLQRVEREGAGTLGTEVVEDLPLGLELVHDEVSHDRGEGLVQSQTVPPCHGDLVAVPLVIELVEYDFNNPLLLLDRRLELVDQKRGGPVGDQTGVLHSARTEVRDGDHVNLVAAEVRTVEEHLEPLDAEGGSLDREALQVVLARNGPDANLLATHEDGLGAFELTDAVCHQVGGLLRRRVEGDQLVGRSRDDVADAIIERGLRLDAPVGEGSQSVVDDQLDVERGLKSRLVPARESATGVGGLELRGADPVIDAGVISPLAAIETLQARLHKAARVGDEELPGACAQSAVEVERSTFGFGIQSGSTGELDVAVLGGVLVSDLHRSGRHQRVKAGAVGVDDVGGGDLQLLGVELNAVDRAANIDVNFDGAVKGEGAEVRRLANLVVQRNHGSGELVLRHILFGRNGCVIMRCHFRSPIIR